MGFQREEATTDGSIQSFNFGGLNTTASRLNVPFTDATELLNVTTTLDGTLAKRNGTVQLDTNAPIGIVNYSTSIRSVSGNNYIVSMRSNRLDVFSRRNNRNTVVRTSSMTTPNQFSQIQWVHLPDTFSRVLGLSANMQPIEVYLVELQRISNAYNPGTRTFTITSTEIKRFAGDNPTNGTFTDTLYVTHSGGVEEIPGGLCTYFYALNGNGTGTFTITLPANYSFITSVSNLDIIGFRWCWWANSIKWQGDRFFDNISRFNVTANDNNVPIPAPLISDIKFGEETLFLEISKTYSRTDNYALVDPPLTADQYSLSDGSTYVPGTNSFINSAPYFVTFGLARTPFPQPAESIKFSRYRELRLFSTMNRLPDSLDVRVTVNDIPIPHNTSGTPTSGRGSSYILYGSSGLPAGLSGTAKWIGFTSSLPVGVGATQIITITYTAANQGIGWLTTEVIESGFRSGAYRRVYGLCTSLGTAPGVNPTCGCVYQGRLVLGGVATNKSTIVFSGVGADDDPYTNFQITDDLEGLPTDPFDVTISGGDTADFVVGLVEWNNSLFALTRRSVYRVNGGDAPINASRRLVTYISNIGLVNSRSIVRTDTAVYYLSDGGVFNLTPKVEDSEFTAVEKSLKVRDLIGNRDPLKLGSALMYFDSKRRKLYVTLPNSSDVLGEASDVLVFDTVRESWSVIELLNGLKANSLIESVDNVTGSYNVVASTPTGNLMFDAVDRFTDRTSTFTGATSYNYVTTVGYAVPSISEGQRYNIPDYVLTLPYRQIKDLRIFVGTTAPVEVSFTKFTNYVYLDVPTPANTKVWFVMRSPVNDSPQGVSLYGTATRYPYTLTRNNVEELTATEALVFDSANNVANLTVSFSGVPSDVFVIGMHYPCNYTSAMFTQQVLGSMKRTKHAYLYFNNTSNNVTTSGNYVEGYITPVNVNVAMLYDSDDNDVNTSVDIYGYRDILWDNAYFDTPESSYRDDAYTLFKEPLIGLGYAYRLAVFSYDSARWVLVGYQIDASNSKGLRYINAR